MAKKRTAVFADIYILKTTSPSGSAIARRGPWMATSIVLFGAVLFLKLMGTSAASQDLGDPAIGRGLARDICAICHGVEPDSRESPNPNAPSFRTLADTPGMNRRALAAALATSHRSMPNLELSPEETRDLSAYILRLGETR